MCTVTYIPTRNGFTLTHNRDEAPSRSLFSIEAQHMANGDNLLFPRDAAAGGTWIVTAQSGKTACLLNGAFERHQRTPPYRRSRGLMMLDFFNEDNPNTFFDHYELEGLEPFTFLFFQPGEVVEFRWDGAKKYYKPLPANEPHFWCSATLYPGEMQVTREQVFRTWLGSKKDGETPDPQALMQLHLTGSVGDPEYDFVMAREGRVQTVSITQVVFRKNNSSMRYLDLLEGNRDERLLLVKDR